MKKSNLFVWNNLLAVQACLWTAVWSADNRAVELTDKLSVNPFFSQSLVYTSDNNFHGNSDDGVSLRSNELGAVFNYRWHDNLNFSAQVMARNAGEMDDGKVRADYLFAQYRFHESLDSTLALKLGKLRLPYGLHNDTRDVATTNSSIIMSQSSYIDRGRNTFFSADGVVLSGTNYWRDVSINWDIGSVKIEPDDDEMSDLAGFPAEENADGESKMLARIVAGFDNDALRLAYSYRESEFELTPDIPGIRFAPGTLDNEAHLLSLQYTTERWTVTAEWGRGDTNASLNITEVYVDPPGMWVPNLQSILFKFPNEGYYLQAEYRIDARLTLLLRRDEIYASRDDRKGKELVESLEAFPAFARPDFSQYAIDNVIGLTWNISPKALARIEWHNVEGTFYLSGRDNPDHSETTKFWDMVAVQFAYRF